MNINSFQNVEAAARLGSLGTVKYVCQNDPDCEPGSIWAAVRLKSYRISDEDSDEAIAVYVNGQRVQE